ncbi:recombinase family protein [Chitinophaga silvisoli]|uniref:Resolvase/invertase-type recombinase catalytic domain-containing protein n=1 Tax=Chitinophaga silvisoli TaxID=2291814 RepID=A0A3E1P2J1_9BACT|nr:hypothetical protein [Chitinophaga silvisoli]RFM34406.1 hypothetical protein DXN04_14080 [Chitinophaga silvisoli]
MQEINNVGIWKLCDTDPANANIEIHFEENARRFCMQNGWDVADIYRLGDVPVTDDMNYPEYRRILNDVMEGKISRLIILENDTKPYPDIVYSIGIILKNFGMQVMSLNEATMKVAPIKITVNPAWKEFFGKTNLSSIYMQNNEN